METFSPTGLPATGSNGGFEFAFAGVIDLDFTQVAGASVGRHGPQYVGEKFRAEFGRRNQTPDLGFNIGDALLGFDLSFAVCLGNRTGGSKVHFR